MGKKYSITAEKCEIMTEGKVCPGCGGPLYPCETVDNADNPTYWAACESCQSFSWGVRPIIFEIAEKMVKEQFYIHYSWMDRPNEKSTTDQRAYYLSSQIRGTCGMVRQVIDNLNLFQSIKKEEIG